ncbi:MAG: alpha/beta fold hydrolase [Pyrinomonadaceae bacterium]
MNTVLFTTAMLLLTGCFSQTTVAASDTSVIKVKSKDGTRIAVECTGNGPTLLIVHGGTGDRTRWKPLFPLFASHFKVCAMDRRGHGDSDLGPNYSLKKEFEDIAAVVNILPGPLFLMGHSLGGVCALEATFLTRKVSKLVLYEPPLQDLDHTAVAETMEKMIRTGDRERALTTFLQDIVGISPSEISAMKARPTWAGRVAGVDIQIREIRAISRYRFDSRRIHKVQLPTLLLTGGRTASPQLKQAITGLMDTLPNRTLVAFETEEHNAMDNIPQQFADVVTMFLLGSS